MPCETFTGRGPSKKMLRIVLFDEITLENSNLFRYINI